MPIVAIGTDLVALERLQQVWQQHPQRFLQRHFAPVELEYCLSKADPLPSLGARFAAKEAFQKCWPENFGWREVWVETDGRRPYLSFVEAIAHPMRLDNLRAHLSLSHERTHALAVVVLERVEL
ncbi:MAG: 4'-phosphopantetheinyl transferase superfamily protein [Thermaceae bacterium]|nr:4'-phosphopantetheinyl transferase superfamily protein [Thermaceae bacterium]